MLISQAIMGWVMIVVGIVLLVFAFLGTWFLIIYAIPLILLGIFILNNRKEDEIEKIKKKKGVKG
jgi:uncharacterized integral membrane protein|tara:strand:+ start:906 stop:1100 length:195 start_codon:yes stop_codon:yes gene_type:complete